MDANFATEFYNRIEQITNLTSETISPTISFECLLDAFMAIYTDCKGLSSQSEHVQSFLSKYDRIISKVKSLRVNTQDFDIVQTLATGAVGKVCLVKEKNHKKVYAMKILKKMDLLTRREAAFFMEERDALVIAQSSEWITTLYSAFQDEEHLYLVMEYASGGSLRNLINNRETTMEEDEAKFYTAEMLLALEALHNLNFIHRDVKPENYLIDSSGHIKLADFGSCMKVGNQERITSGETVGTPDYISPEILRAHEGNVSYGQGCDWWSLGIILYELLYDEVPFYSESLTETYGKIMDHEKHFAFPEDDDIQISPEVEDLMRKLICKQEIRIGNKGASEIKNHKWFSEFTWEGIRSSKPPFIPELSGPDDTRYFEDEEDESKKFNQKALKKSRDYGGNNLPFIGYSYLQNAKPTVTIKKGSAVASTTSDTVRSSASNPSDINKIIALEKEIAQLKAASKEAPKVEEFNPKLQKEIDSLNKKLEKETAMRIQLETAAEAKLKENSELEASMKQMKYDRDHETHERKELEEKLNQVKKTLEKEVKAKEGFHDLEDAKLRLEKQVAKLQSELESEKTQTAKHMESTTELNKANAGLEWEVDQHKKQLKQAENNTLTLQKTVEDLESQLASEVEKLSEAKKQNTYLSQLETDFNGKMVTVEAKLTETNSKLEAANQTISKIEREKAVVSVELNAANQKLQELGSEIKSLQSNIAEKEKSKTGALENVEHLAEEVQKETAIKKQLKDDLSELQKTKALLQVELSEALQNLKQESEAKSKLQSEMDQLQKKVSDLERTVKDLNSDKENISEQSSKQANEFSIVQQQLREARSQLNVSNLKAGSLEKKNALLTAEVEELRQSIGRGSSQTTDYETKLAELETAFYDERRQRSQKETALQSSKQEKTELQEEVIRLQSRIVDLKSEQTKSLRDNQGRDSKIAALQTKLEYISKSSENMFNLSTNRFESELIKMQSSLTKEQEKNAKLNKLIETIEQANTEHMQQNDELNSQLIEAEGTIARLNAKMLELEHQSPTSASSASTPPRITTSASKRISKSLDLLRHDSLSSPSKGDRSSFAMLKGDGGHPREGKRGAKLRSVFFKNTGKEREERALAFQKIADLEDDMKKSTSSEMLGSSNHNRKESYASSTISRETFTSFKSKDSRRPSDHYDFSDGLKGWIKIPKQGRIKKGWRKVYGIVKDFKLCLYEKEKDSDDNLKPIETYDLRSSIIYAKNVTQAELIHANSRDIDSIFKLHLCNDSPTVVVPSSPFKEGPPNLLSKASIKKKNRASTGNLLSNDAVAIALKDANNPTNDPNKRITQLQAYIAIEEKYAHGAQNILNAATTDAQKTMASTQLEQFHKNIREWKAELEKLVADYHAQQPQMTDQMRRQSMAGLSQKVFDQDTADWTRDLEESLRKKYNEKEAILKILKTQSVGINVINSKPSHVKIPGAPVRDVDGALVQVDKDISKLVDEIEVLKGENKPKIESLLRNLNERAALNACNGHYFKKRVLNKPMDCGQCKEALWLATDGVKTVMECEVCHAICHNYCKLDFDISCQDYVKLKDIQPIYFMAMDSQDRNRWLAGIDHFIRESERITYSNVTTPTESREHSFIKQTSGLSITPGNGSGSGRPISFVASPTTEEVHSSYNVLRRNTNMSTSNPTLPLERGESQSSILNLGRKKTNNSNKQSGNSETSAASAAATPTADPGSKEARKKENRKSFFR